MRESWIKRGVAFVMAAGLLAGVQSAPGPSGDWAPLRWSVGDPKSALAADECDWYVLFPVCGLDSDTTETSNHWLYLFDLQHPCGGAFAPVSANDPKILFRWSQIADPPAQSSVPENLTLRLAFRAEGDSSIYWWPGGPGYHTAALNPSDGEVWFDVNDLPGLEFGPSGIDRIWHWRLVDQYREHSFETGLPADSEGNPVEGRMSGACSFRLVSEPEASPPAPQPSGMTDNQTQSFPSAGPTHTALSPCGATLNITEQDQNETFTYSTNSQAGVIMEFLKAGTQTWQQYSKAASFGVMPPGQQKVNVNVNELLEAEDQDDWQWRIRDPYVTTSFSNACAFHIEKATTPAPPPPPALVVIVPTPTRTPAPAASTPQGYKQQASYSGNCASRPADTVCLAFSDGFVWLVSDAILSQQDRGSFEGLTIRVAEGRKSYYFHMLGTSWVRELKK